MGDIANGSEPATADRPERWEIAIHEAGHMVVAWAERVPIVFATIEPEGDADGYCAPWAATRQTQTDLEHAIRVSLGGPVASQQLDPSADIETFLSDYYQTVRLLKRLAEFGGSGVTVVRLRGETEHIVRHHWPLIEAVAWKLIADRSVMELDVRRLARTAGIRRPRLKASKR
jgi:hypothetical protein